MRAEQTSFLFGANAPFIEELYARYLADANTVDPEWRTFFEALADQKTNVLAEVRGASWAPNGARVIDVPEAPVAANKNVTKFTIDSSWDDPQHREGWYFRSDHLSYARAGVPALFFTTLLHPDYHTPRDNPDRIDLAKLTRMTRWMYATGRLVGETDKRPAVDPNFKLER